MMYDVEVSVLREVRADSPEEAQKIARSLVIAMPHLNPRTCPTDPEVNATVHELQETGAAEAAAERRASLERAKAFAEAMAGKPYVAPGYNAPLSVQRITTTSTPQTNAAGEVCCDQIVPHVENISTGGTYSIVDDSGQVRARYDATCPEEAIDMYMAEAPSPIAAVDALLEEQ